MIRINLQTVGARKQRRKAAAAVDVGGGSSNLMPALMLMLPVLAGLGGSYYVHAALLDRIETTNDAIREGEVELARLKPILDELNQFKKDRDLLKRKLAAIRALENNRMGPVRIYAELAAIMPAQIWVTNIRENAGVAMIDGMGLDAQSIAIFVNSMARSRYFANVELTVVEHTKYLGLDIKKFNVVCRFQNPNVGTATAQANPAAGPAGSAR